MPRGCRRITASVSIPAQPDEPSSSSSLLSHLPPTIQLDGVHDAQGCDATIPCWRIQVRVTWFFDYTDDSTPKKILRRDFVLLDEQGTSMETQIPERHLPLFGSALCEDHIYFIEYFEVANAKSSYQAVSCPIMARFTRHTRITEVTTVPPDFPLYAYTFVSFDILRTRIGQNRLLSDAIGLVTGISHIKTVPARGIMKIVRNVNITDGREIGCVALWGPHASAFDVDVLQTASANDPIIVLFVGLTVKLYQGQLSLQGSTVCRWYQNILISEILALRNSFAIVPHENYMVWSSLDSAGST